MTLSEWKELSDIVSNVVTAIGVLVGGGWALWKFGIQREAHAKIEFDLDLKVLGRQDKQFLVEIAAIVHNKGLVRHWLQDFRFDLLYLPKSAEIQCGDARINEQVLFQPLFKKRYWIPPDWISSFIDPGVRQRYTYISSVPDDASYILVFAIFKYPDEESEFHTAQKVWPIETPTTANKSLQPTVEAGS